LELVGNIGDKNGVKMYTRANDSHRITITSEQITLYHDKIEIESSGNIKLKSNSIEVTATANNQHGIYARFAWAFYINFKI